MNLSGPRRGFFCVNDRISWATVEKDNKDKKSRTIPTIFVATNPAPGRGASVLDYFAGLTLKNSIKDIVDVLIVSYIIYRLIIMVRGTRAVQLLRGILLLVIILALSTWLNLYTLKWLMNQIFTFGIVTVAVIFQPELRRALEQLGRGKLFTRSSPEEQDISHQINEVIKSVNYLARRKIGALIVFERNTGLNDYIESGIKMNSKLSSELLKQRVHSEYAAA